jgi:hypothetical protein
MFLEKNKKLNLFQKSEIRDYSLGMTKIYNESIGKHGASRATSD